MKRKIFFVYVLVACCALTFSSIGETAPIYPSKPITLIIPWPPGTSADLATRGICKSAGQLFGQPVIVMNKPGGGGFIGTGEASRATPDGYTLIYLHSSTIALAPHLREAPFDPWKLTPIMSHAIYPFQLAVKGDAPWKTIKEFVEFIRQNPKVVKISAASADIMEALAMRMLKEQEKLDFDIVPSGGGPEGIAAVLGGHVHAVVSAADGIPPIKDGSLRGLATMLSVRMPGLRDVPTLKECGYDVVVESRICVYGPPGLPKDIVKKLEQTFKQAMASEELNKIYKLYEFTPSFLGSEDLDKYHRDLSAKLRATLIKIGRIKE